MRPRARPRPDDLQRRRPAVVAQDLPQAPEPVRSDLVHGRRLHAEPRHDDGRVALPEQHEPALPMQHRPGAGQVLLLPTGDLQDPETGRLQLDEDGWVVPKGRAWLGRDVLRVVRPRCVGLDGVPTGRHGSGLQECGEERVRLHLRRLPRLREALSTVLERTEDRAEQVQMIFSRDYDDNWQKNLSVNPQ